MIHPFSLILIYLKKKVGLISKDRRHTSFKYILTMGKDTSQIAKRIMELSEQIYIHKELRRRQTNLRFLYSRLSHPPPSTIFLKDIIEEGERSISEMINDVQKLLLPLLKGIQFNLKEKIVLSVRDMERGFIILYDHKGVEYILFLKPFNNGLVNIPAGSLEKNDHHQVSRIAVKMRQLSKKDTKTKSLFEILMNQK